jgi:hypothetical protein
MAFPRKESRLIVVDGRRYRWRLSRLRRRQEWRYDPTYDGDVRFTVQLEDQGGSMLIVDVPNRLPDDKFDGIGLIMPSIVAHCIKVTIQRGWDPMRAGKPFTFRPRKIQDVLPGTEHVDRSRFYSTEPE